MTLKDISASSNGTPPRNIRRIVKQYPKLKIVADNLKVVKDKEFSGIEFYGKDLPKYSDIYSSHPNPDGYGIRYNPKDTRKNGKIREAIAGDMLHGMHDDPEYEKLYNVFADHTRKKYNENMKDWFTKKGNSDGYDAFERNEIDGRIRQFIQPHNKEHKIFESELTPEMRESGNQIVNYLKQKYKYGGDMNLQEVIRFRSGYNPNTGRYKMTYNNVGDKIDPMRLESMKSIKRYFGPGGPIDPKVQSKPRTNWTPELIAKLEAQGLITKGHSDEQLSDGSRAAYGNNYKGYDYIDIAQKKSIDDYPAEIRGQMSQEGDFPTNQNRRVTNEYFTDSANNKSIANKQSLYIDPYSSFTSPYTGNKKEYGGSIRRMDIGGEKYPYSPRTGEYTPNQSSDYTDPTYNNTPMSSRFSLIKPAFNSKSITSDARDYVGGKPIVPPTQQSISDKIVAKNPNPKVGSIARTENPTQSNNIDDLLPYASNLVNSFRRLPNPIAPPTESPINPALVNYDADRGVLDRDYRSFGKETDYRVSNPAVAQAIKATAYGKKIQGENQLAQQEGNTNAFIKNQTAQANQQVIARSIERTREFNNENISRNTDQQRLQSENLANFSDKEQLQRRDKAQMDLEGRKLAIQAKYFRDSGIKGGIEGRNLADSRLLELKAAFPDLTEAELKKRFGFKYGGQIKRNY